MSLLLKFDGIGAIVAMVVPCVAIFADACCRIKRKHRTLNAVDLASVDLISSDSHLPRLKLQHFVDQQPATVSDHKTHQHAAEVKQRFSFADAFRGDNLSDHANSCHNDQLEKNKPVEIILF